MAQRLRQFLRNEDTVARIGGDEFVFVFPELSNDEAGAASLVMAIAEKIRAALEQPSHTGQHEYRCTASMGATLFPKGANVIDDVIREADIAMYRAKSEGRNKLVYFEPEMQKRVEEHYTLEQDLRKALGRDEFQVYLQSQVSADGSIIGAEALVRWNHPVRGMLPPGEFIRFAEDTGAIVPLGKWVLRQACQVIATLAAEGRSTRIAVNISPRQFLDLNFVRDVDEILRETRADPQALTLEITENLLLNDEAEVMERMRALVSKGIHFSIDDFGTGYSSLSYLRRMPVSEIKIDRSFVQGLAEDIHDAELVKTIIALGANLKFGVVAEGVETKEQVALLSALGCSVFQGYLYCRPIPIPAWLASL